MNPEVGMLATVRNRRGIVSAVDPFDGPDGRLHLVTLEYADGDGVGEDRLIWEREPKAGLVPPAALPRVADEGPMPHADFDALVRATRWSALTPFLDPEDTGRPLDEPTLAAPLHGAVEVDDFQLVPLLKALRMPRVSLLLADDVGLGKTIEAGLVLTELLLRRRIRRVLILCPASLRGQWHDEMKQKFSLDFDHVDRESTHALRRSLGLDANPWRTHARVIASYYYLRQPDVLEEFLAASRQHGDDARLPWDLLIVDEAHNLSPAPFGEDSELSRMLASIVPYFEHKLFLTATPHNGHTRSFSGLLERLDPMRFTQSSELKGAARARVEDVLVRRLKREINAVTNPPRFAERVIEPIELALAAGEQALSRAFADFRSSVRRLIAERRREEQLAGAFAVEILGKRLLSCPVAFADSWHRYLAGAREDEGAAAREVQAAERTVREDLDDDQELESRTAHASQVVGAWLKPFSDALTAETAAIDAALAQLGLAAPATGPNAAEPTADTRLDALFALIEQHLRAANTWRSDERLVVFTEYKTTLDYLQHRLAERYPDAGDGAVRTLFGGMPQDERDAIKAAFNRDADPVRILLATDAAAEGLNLQETARYLLHYDIPWNPSRLEQRNGRLDRHGQARDVTIFHFASDQDDDLSFLARVVRKVETIREDLGSVGEVLDAGLRRRLVDGEPADNTWGELDRTLDERRGRISLPRDSNATTAGSTTDDSAPRRDTRPDRLERLRAELDLDAESLRDTLEAALAIGAGRPRLEPLDERGRMRLVTPVPAGWGPLVDDALRVDRGGSRGALPAVVFDPGYFVRKTNGRPVFRHEPDTALLHLGHPLYHRALTTFARRRFPIGSDGQATRWTVRRGGVADGADALLLLTVEELAVNELRESFHHWVRTWCLPIEGDALGAPLPHRPATELRAPAHDLGERDIASAQRLWDEVEPDVRRFVDNVADALSRALTDSLDRARDQALGRETERFRSRQGEINALMGEQSLARLEREVEAIDAELKQQRLFDQAERTTELLRNRDSLEQERRRREQHLEDLSRQLRDERKRVLEQLLPRRYTLHENAQCFPVAVEIRLPEARS